MEAVASGVRPTNISSALSAKKSLTREGGCGEQGPATGHPSGPPSPPDPHPLHIRSGPTRRGQQDLTGQGLQMCPKSWAGVPVTQGKVKRERGQGFMSYAVFLQNSRLGCLPGPPNVKLCGQWAKGSVPVPGSEAWASHVLRHPPKMWNSHWCVLSTHL